jgi:hypothetical protein
MLPSHAALARLSLSVLALVTLALTAPPVERQLVPWGLALAFVLVSTAWDGARAVRAVHAAID